ncbi:hypothetical protein [Lysobacter sp. CA199]|uniref:hypothetical protein n=1 Tax=Lysobacter sp. CA199 TaxID=3455608 RepID=UPI003F8D0FEA
MQDNVVGWFLPRSLEARAIWFDPVRYSWQPEEQKHSGMFLQCPAYQKFARNLFVVRSPFDLHLKCELSQDGCELSVGEDSSIRPEQLAALIKVHPKSEWREADKPLLQLMLNYYFLSDDDVDVQYLSPLTTTFFQPALPGLVLQGRWNIKNWIRPVNFVFEWWHPATDLIIKRGQPILNVMFVPKDLDAKITLIEAEETEDVIAMARRVQNINSYIRNVFSVLPSIIKHRPRRLVRPCKSKSN